MNKKPISSKIETIYVEALDVISENSSDFAPFKNKSQLLSYIVKSFIYQNVKGLHSYTPNDEESQKRIQKALNEIGLTEKTLAGYKPTRYSKFVILKEEVSNLLEQRKTLRAEIEGMKNRYEREQKRIAKIPIEIMRLYINDSKKLTITLNDINEYLDTKIKSFMDMTNDDINEISDMLKEAIQFDTDFRTYIKKALLNKRIIYKDIDPYLKVTLEKE